MSNPALSTIGLPFDPKPLRRLPMAALASAQHAKLERRCRVRGGCLIDFEFVVRRIQCEFDIVDDGQECEGNLNLGKSASQAAVSSQAERSEGTGLPMLRSFWRVAFDIETPWIRIILGQMVRHGVTDDDPCPSRHGVAGELERVGHGAGEPGDNRIHARGTAG